VGAVADLTGKLADPDPGVRAAALTGLGGIGLPAASAESAVAGALKDSDPVVRDAARRALPRLGPKAVAAALPLLRDGRAEVRQAAAAALRDGVLKTADLGSVLAPLLADANAEVRREAVLALITSKNSPWIQRGLTAGISDSEATVREAVAQAAASLRLDEGSVRTVAGLLRHSREEVVVMALEVLSTAGSGDGAVLAALEECARSGPEKARRNAVGVLVKLESDTTRKASLLGRLLAAKDPRVRTDAAFQLGKLQSVPPPVRTALERAAKDPDEGVRLAAQEALQRLGASLEPGGG
jgi:HEAT repeat protein